jgi:NAD(P)-dependent dehydrogenase (short-subunit alcohol dehydrogenase family)
MATWFITGCSTGLGRALVNNAGHGYRAAVEEASDDQVRELFATNFFGPVALIQEVLPSMRERRTGTIVTISSGGVRSCPIGAGHYVATKAALEALTTSLGKELDPLGITVMTVEPGAFRTNYKRSLTQVRQAIDAYRDTVGLRRGEDLTEHDSVEELHADIDAWRHTSLGTSFPEGS